MLRALLNHAVWTIGLLAIAGYVWVVASPLVDPPIHSDGISYYIYLPAFIADGDATFETAAQDCCGGYLADPIGIHRWPETGRWLAVHPIGAALLMLPFFLAAQALTWWSNLPPDGFSFYFQYLVPLAGPAYLAAGLVALRRLLRRHFTDGVVLATIVAITFGTNLFHYAVFDGTFSHVYSFCVFAWFLLFTDSWWDEPSWPASLGLGAAAALLFMLRHPNAIFLVVMPLYGVTGVASLGMRVRMLWARRWNLCAIALITLACVAPQLAIYRWATGHWFVSAYPGGYFTFGAPHLYGTLFSVERGVFFWSPLLLLAIAGMALARGWARGLVAAALAILVVHTYLLASWYIWDLGVGYGHRAYVDTLPLFAIFLAVFFGWTAGHRALVWPVRVLASVLVALSVIQMLQYWVGVMPGQHTTWDQYRSVFLHFR